MSTKTSAFWRTYRKDAILGWAYLIATPVLPICLGVINHFFLDNQQLISNGANYLALIPFGMFFYHAWKYKFALCPNCNKPAAKFKNLVFPIDPVCPHCGKRMDMQDGSLAAN